METTKIFCPRISKKIRPNDIFMILNSKMHIIFRFVLDQRSPFSLPKAKICQNQGTKEKTTIRRIFPLARGLMPAMGAVQTARRIEKQTASSRRAIKKAATRCQQSPNSMVACPPHSPEVFYWRVLYCIGFQFNDNYSTFEVLDPHPCNNRIIKSS